VIEHHEQAPVWTETGQPLAIRLARAVLATA
jgi:hypothetical protein